MVMMSVEPVPINAPFTTLLPELPVINDIGVAVLKLSIVVVPLSPLAPITIVPAWTAFKSACVTCNVPAPPTTPMLVPLVR